APRGWDGRAPLASASAAREKGREARRSRCRGEASSCRQRCSMLPAGREGSVVVVMVLVVVVVVAVGHALVGMLVGVLRPGRLGRVGVAVVPVVVHVLVAVGDRAVLVAVLVLAHGAPSSRLRTISPAPHRPARSDPWDSSSRRPARWRRRRP